MIRAESRLSRDARAVQTMNKQIASVEATMSEFAQDEKVQIMLPCVADKKTKESVEDMIAEIDKSLKVMRKKRDKAKKEMGNLESKVDIRALFVQNTETFNAVLTMHNKITAVTESGDCEMTDALNAPVRRTRILPVRKRSLKGRKGTRARYSS